MPTAGKVWILHTNMPGRTTHLSYNKHFLAASIGRGVSISASWGRPGQAASKPEEAPIGTHKGCQNPPNTTEHGPSDDIARVMRSNIHAREADQYRH